MEMMPVKPERKAQLEAYAELQHQSPEEALDDLLAGHFDSDPKDYDATVQSVAQAYESVKAGRTRPAEEFLAEFRVTHDLPHSPPPTPPLAGFL